MKDAGLQERERASSKVVTSSSWSDGSSYGQQIFYYKLATLLGPDKPFHGKQEATIKAIMSGQSPVAAITGTGYGQSVLFMLPAIIASGGVTIVMTLLVSL